ncbi:MAG: helix-turn-helix domain-containing protein [Erysipelotrichaceae bacterium]|nr:helix-turn-helix domain-containing protein [Erysipelotrichaceae bacterium]
MNKVTDQYKDLLVFFAESTTSTCEYILFDLSLQDFPVVMHINKREGNLKCARRLLNTALQNEKIIKAGKLTRRFETNDYGKPVKVSLLFLKEGDIPVGAVVLCINLAPYLELSARLNELTYLNMEEIDQIPMAYPSTEPVSLNTISHVIAEYGIEKGRFTLQERTELLCDLMDLDVFEIKGSIERVANEVGVSKQTIYREVAKLKKYRG